MKSAEIRQKFLEYFKSKNHIVKRSANLVPKADPTLLFTAAGMVQFKPYLLGIKKDIKRAVSCQKCLRTTDIDSVGYTDRHLTFFEMLGNFSFGDYFKKDAIEFSWDFLTNHLGLDKNRLYISVYKGGIAPRDKEAYEIWQKYVPKDRIFEYGEEDNFWTVGPTGPCGPCSEVYYDFGENHCKECKGPNCDCSRFVEIWNLVFTQFDKQEDGSLKQLPKKNIDTGMGLERLAMALQDVNNPFETDLFENIIKETANILDIKKHDENVDTALKIISDHIRASVFLISEGILPSNEGRGYVLRRLIRRALRYGKKIGAKTEFLYELSDICIQGFENVYPELKENAETIKETILQEEKTFGKTLNAGLEKLKEILDKSPKKLSGKETFWLYETYGFPFELTQEIASSQSVEVDRQSFDEQKEIARTKSKKQISEAEKQKSFLIQELEEKLPKTKFVGYETLDEKAKILALLDENFLLINGLSQGSIGYAILDTTPFYAEGGGQVGDIGTLKNKKEILANVVDTQRPLENLIIHKVEALQDLKINEKVLASVDHEYVKKVSANHTSTHLINEGLRQIFGDKVRQAGSYVSSDKFRFDYTCPRAMNKVELQKLEHICNDAIKEEIPVLSEIYPLKYAKKFGAVMLMGEEYQDPSRFVLISKKGFKDTKEKFSLELCGGRHVSNTGDILKIKIIKDRSISSGIRRIEGVSGLSVMDYLEKEKKQVEKEKKSKEEKKQKQKEHSAKPKQKEEIKLSDDKNLIVSFGPNIDINVLRDVSDNLTNEETKTIVLVFSDINSKRSFIIRKTKDLDIDISNIAKTFAKEINGSAGGRVDFAQGGCDTQLSSKEFINKLKNLL